ncbi:hypothetical protein N7527_004912 [Penicillium freii]|nr:hypothetical protein N7527_004912 [Penicillium freii]
MSPARAEFSMPWWRPFSHAGSSTPKHGALRSLVGILRWGFPNNLDCVEVRDEVDTTSKINLNPDDTLHAPTLYGRE